MDSQNLKSYRFRSPNSVASKVNVKLGYCKIGLLHNRNILMRFNQQEDFINMMSKLNYYILDKDGIRT